MPEKKLQIQKQEILSNSKRNNGNGTGDDSHEDERSAQEYRLIPVREEGSSNKDNAVNLPELYRLLRDKRWLITKITAGFVILGLIIALFSSEEFTSEALLMPDTKNNQSTAGSLLQNYGSMFGLGGLGSSTLTNDGFISPTVYPEIVKSLTFQNRLLKKEIYFSNLDTTISGYTYFREVRGPSMLEYVMEYTIGLPQKLHLSDPTDTTPDWLSKRFEDVGVVSLTREQLEVIGEMKERITISLDSETGVLQVTAKMPDAPAAAQVNRAVIDMLKEFIKSFSTQKAKEDLAFAKKQHQQALDQLEATQNALATFQDQNVNLSTAKSKTKVQRLEAEFDVAYNMYDNVSQQLLAAKMKVQEQTPAFKPLQEANVPVEKSEPKRLLIIVVSLFVGGIVSFLYIAGQSIYQNVQYRA